MIVTVKITTGVGEYDEVDVPISLKPFGNYLHKTSMVCNVMRDDRARRRVFPDIMPGAPGVLAAYPMHPDVDDYTSRNLADFTYVMMIAASFVIDIRQLLLNLSNPGSEPLELVVGGDHPRRPSGNLDWEVPTAEEAHRAAKKRTREHAQEREHTRAKRARRRLKIDVEPTEDEDEDEDEDENMRMIRIVINITKQDE